MNLKKMIVLRVILACLTFYFGLIVYLQKNIILYSINPSRVKQKPFPFKPVQRVEYSNIGVGGV